MIQDANYITIFGWMLTGLKLSGNKLNIYAIIYGFSQDGRSEFTGSIDYLAEWLGCTRKTVMNTLDYLVKKKLIVKRKISYNRYAYKANLEMVKKLHHDGEKFTPSMVKKLHHDGEKFTPNNNSNNNNKNNSNKRTKFSNHHQRDIDANALEKMLLTTEVK